MGCRNGMKKKKPHDWRGLAVPPCWASGSITGSLSWELIYRGIKTSWALEPSAVPGSLPGHPSRGSGPQWPSPALPPPVLPKPFPAATAVLGSPNSASSLIHRAGPGRGLGLPGTAFPPFPCFRSPCPQPAPCEFPLDPSWLFLPPFRGAPAQCWAVLRGSQPLPPGPGPSAAKPSRAHLQKWHFGQSFQSASSPAPAAAQVPGMDLQEPGQRLWKMLVMLRDFRVQTSPPRSPNCV